MTLITRVEFNHPSEGRKGRDSPLTAAFSSEASSTKLEIPDIIIDHKGHKDKEEDHSGLLEREFPEHRRENTP